jgi:hypothetical protein
MTDDDALITAEADDVADDVRAAAEARAELAATGEAPIPWEVVKAELGL